jgi:hypothetical protein
VHSNAGRSLWIHDAARRWRQSRDALSPVLGELSCSVTRRKLAGLFFFCSLTRSLTHSHAFLCSNSFVPLSHTLFTHLFRNRPLLALTNPILDTLHAPPHRPPSQHNNLIHVPVVHRWNAVHVSVVSTSGHTDRHATDACYRACGMFPSIRSAGYRRRGWSRVLLAVRPQYLLSYAHHISCYLRAAL